ncbi:hypothetical protein [Thermococcus sp.]|jgi:hypothetical protein|uniref:hypothetical protein n=1 Tax=Thermococcus sp. TaxID=35749 RepID=UPI002634EE00|nr:hypothetical protein [Thermococcus sp.]
MMSLEFEAPLYLLNPIMDLIMDEDAKLQWVYYHEPDNSVVIRVDVARKSLETFLLRLASVVTSPVEVTIVDEREEGRFIHEAFLLHVDVGSKSYPVVVMLFYNISKFYPDTIVVGTSDKAPPELIDSVLNLTVGKVKLLDAEMIKSSVIDDGRFIYLRTHLPGSHKGEILVV